MKWWRPGEDYAAMGSGRTLLDVHAIRLVLVIRVAQVDTRGPSCSVDSPMNFRPLSSLSRKGPIVERWRCPQLAAKLEP
jgi:hypothetical protein